MNDPPVITIFDADSNLWVDAFECIGSVDANPFAQTPVIHPHSASHQHPDGHQRTYA